MNLGTLIRRTEADELLLDLRQIESVTDAEFVKHLRDNVPDAPITAIKAAQKPGFLYWQSAGEWYSFAYDKKQRTLIASKQVNGKWSFIVGYQTMLKGGVS